MKHLGIRCFCFFIFEDSVVLLNDFIGDTKSFLNFVSVFGKSNNMKKVLLLLISVAFLLYGCTKNQVSINEEIHSAVFKYSHFGVSEAEPTNAAVLITDKDSINNLYALFKNNYLLETCSCGYDFEIQFYDTNGKVIYSEFYFPANKYSKKDNEIKETIKHLSERMLENPSHFIYNIKTDTCFEFTIEELKSKGFLVFMMNDNMKNDSTIQILYTLNFDSLKKELKESHFVERVEKAIDWLYIED